VGSGNYLRDGDGMTQKEFEKYSYFIQGLANLKMTAAGVGLHEIKKLHVTKNTLWIGPHRGNREETGE